MKFKLLTDRYTGKKILFSSIHNPSEILWEKSLNLLDFIEEEVELYTPAQMMKVDNFDEVMSK